MQSKVQSDIQPNASWSLSSALLRHGRLLAWGALAGYVLLLGAIGIVRHSPGGVVGLPPLQLRLLFAPEEWLVRAALAAVGQLAVFTVLGFLVHVAICWPTGKRGGEGKPGEEGGRGSGAKRVQDRSGEGLLGSWRRRLAALAVGGALAVLLSGWPFGGAVSAFALVVPVCGLLLGGSIAAHALRGRWAMLRLAGKLAAVGVLAGAATGVLAYLALENIPLPFEPPEVTPTEKRRLSHLVTHAQPMPGNREHLRWSQHDVEGLLATAMEHAPMEGKARADLGQDAVAGELSVALPRPVPWGRYFNVRGVFRIAVDSGRLRLEPLQLQVGRVRVPTLLLRPLGQVAVAVVHADPYARDTLASIDRLHVTPEAVDMTYRTGQFRDDLVAALRAHLGEPDEVVQATAVYYRHLVGRAEPLPRGDEGFVAAVSSAFALAEERSVGGDPVAENRAAILALAILLGHSRVESFIGTVGTEELRRAGRVYLARARLRGRRDWVQHFFVSAGLTVLTSPAASNGVGLLKEEIDAGPGGSGFSFADLLADRAGTEFARTATRNPAAARRMQRRLAGGFAIDDVFPPAAGLPEGIPDARLQAEYGGVGGPKFRAILDDIERRLLTCAALELGQSGARQVW